MIGTKIGPPDAFREIGFDTSMYLDGMQETIFFVHGCCVDNPHGERRESASPEAVAEFIAYWSRQIETAALYLQNDGNPNTHEWSR